MPREPKHDEGPLLGADGAPFKLDASPLADDPPAPAEAHDDHDDAAERGGE